MFKMEVTAIKHVIASTIWHYLTVVFLELRVFLVSDRSNIIPRYCEWSLWFWRVRLFKSTANRYNCTDPLGSSTWATNLVADPSQTCDLPTMATTTQNKKRYRKIKIYSNRVKQRKSNFKRLHLTWVVGILSYELQNWAINFKNIMKSYGPTMTFLTSLL